MQARHRVLLLLAGVLLASGQSAKAQGACADCLAEDSQEQPRPPHPEPRVIVNVLAVKGPHKPDRVQHDARYGWKRIVRCYKAQGAKEKTAVTLELLVSGEGTVARARSLLCEEKDHELAECLAKTLPGLAMPKATADSKADVEIVLSPGDGPSTIPRRHKPPKN